MPHKVFLYRAQGDKVEAVEFDSDKTPKRGWYDSPGKAKEMAKKATKKEAN